MVLLNRTKGISGHSIQELARLVNNFIKEQQEEYPKTFKLWDIKYQASEPSSSMHYALIIYEY